MTGIRRITFGLEKGKVSKTHIIREDITSRGEKFHFRTLCGRAIPPWGSTLYIPHERGSGECVRCSNLKPNTDDGGDT